MESLDPREVLTHLNDMGFYNITAQQLKDFMHDLKKLIKYDLQKQEEKENTHDNSLSRPDLFDYLYKTSTKSFKAKCSKNKKEYVPLPPEMKKPSSIQHIPERSKSKTRTKPDTTDHVSTNSRFSDTNCSTSTKNNEQYISKESLCTESLDPNLINMKSNSNINIKNTKSKAFIRPSRPKKPVNKSDPVALYHAYQQDWNKFKNQMPGQNNRNALRWNIREKMMAEPR